MAKIMLEEDADNQLLKVPLSNGTISRIKEDTTADISDQFLSSLKTPVGRGNRQS